MLTPRCWFASALVVGLLAGAADAAENWKGTPILPKSAEVSIQADDGSAVSMYDIAWPATVAKTKGRYLWVQDDGGYSRNQAGGWIYCDDAVKLDDAHDHYTSELRRGETAWAYWMRGISWESKGEPGVALVDYKNALRVEPNTGIDDIQIRFGRVLAAEQLLGGRGEYYKNLRTTWENHFKRAKEINPNRPQLYYEWGYALSQACDCTISKQVQELAAKTQADAQAKVEADAAAAKKASKSGGAAAPAKSDSEPAPKHGKKSTDDVSKVAVSRGQPDADGEPDNELPRPAKKPKPKPAPATPVDPAAPEPLATIHRPGPTAAGSEAAVQALDQYVTAETLSPNWWRIPLARAELMLGQCDEESPTGERVAISPVDVDFFGKLLSHGRQSRAQASDSAAPSGDAASTDVAQAATRGVAASGEEVASAKPLPSKPDQLSPAATQVLNIAIEDFNRAISLNPNALDAYRDRAEVLRVVNRPAEAQESATTACNLCYYRQARSLRTLAQVCKTNKHYQMAADYALRAAELTSAEEQQRFLQLWYGYSQLTKGDTAKIAAESAKIGYVASRGQGDDEDGTDNSKPPEHINPPPGFLSRTGAGD